MRIIAVVLVIVILNACSGGQVAAQFEQMRAMWQEREPAGYSYVVSLDCFCTEESRGPFEVEVQEGVASVTRLGSPTEVSSLPVDPSIAGLLELIESNLDAHLLEIRYDGDYGYPQSIVVDPAEDVFDDELGVQITGFVSR